MKTVTEQLLFEFTPSIGDLELTREGIERGFGYAERGAPEVTSDLIDEVLGGLLSRIDLRCGFTLIPPGQVKISADRIRVGNVCFSSGSIITKRLRRCSSIALFVATAGEGISRWKHEESESGDMLKEFIIDAIGSEIAEQLSEWLERKISETVQQFGWLTTNRYSPGYCDWFVGEQQILFSLLPENFCGVRLTESALMVPLKSVSGIVGLGEKAVKEEYECAICTVKDCYRRRE